MSNIDKQARQVQRFANYGVNMMEWADGGYVKHSDYLALQDELEGEKGRTKELESQRALAFTSCNRWADKFRESEAKLEAAEKRIAELTDDCWIYEGTVKKLLERAEAAESACSEAARILESGERMALTRSVEILRAAAAGKGE